MDPLCDEDHQLILSLTQLLLESTLLYIVSNTTWKLFKLPGKPQHQRRCSVDVDPEADFCGTESILLISIITFDCIRVP